MGMRELIVNLALLAGICALGYLVTTIEPPKEYSYVLSDFEGGGTAAPPGAPDSETIYSVPIPLAPRNASLFNVRAENWDYFGSRLLFRTIIVKPTPSPTPTPKPIVPPPLAQMLAGWDLQSVHNDRKTGVGVAWFHDKQKNDMFKMEVGGEPVDKFVNTRTIKVSLIAINAAEWSATMQSDWHEDFKQEPLVLKMF